MGFLFEVIKCSKIDCANDLHIWDYIINHRNVKKIKKSPSCNSIDHF